AGAAWCWGYDGTDDHGRGEPPPFDMTPARTMPADGTDKPQPEQVPGDLAFASIHAGALSTCGLTAGGTAYCWGFNLDGRLGVASALINTPNPTAVSGGLQFRSLAGGGYWRDGHNCGVTTSNEAWCWGGNFYGQLGVGGIARHEAPARIGTTGMG